MQPQPVLWKAALAASRDLNIEGRGVALNLGIRASQEGFEVKKENSGTLIDDSDRDIYESILRPERRG